MHRLGFAVCLLIGLAVPARAQEEGYVGGVVFADLQRASGLTSTTYPTVLPRLDGTVAGGGMRGGYYLAPRLTLELSVDIGRTIEKTLTPQIVPLMLAAITDALTPVVYYPLRFEQRVSSRTTATSSSACA
jgi:hypothetical protein